MAVVGLKDDWNDKEFNDLTVPVEIHSEDFCSCKNGKGEDYASDWNEYQVYTFDHERVN